MKSTFCLTILLACFFVSMLAAEPPADKALHEKPHWREPIALTAVKDRIYTANRRSGTVSVLAADNLEVIAEAPVGRRLSDLAVMHSGETLVAVDESSHQLIVLKPTPSGVAVQKRIAVDKTPVRVAVDAGGTRCAVACLWSRRVNLFGSDKGTKKLSRRAVVDLPFAPRNMLWLEEQNRLIAADSFGGRLAVIDPDGGRILSVKKIAGHNIRGLALGAGGKDLLVAQQVLDASSKTMHTPVFWGNLMQNVLRSQSLEELFAAEENRQTGDLFRTEPLGHPSNATGDPYDVRVLPGGQTVVSLSGVGEIAIRPSDLKPFERFDAQAHSTAILPHPDGRRLLVANTFADSITMFDLKNWGIAGHISLGPTSPLSQRDQGKRLFYDARLSLDGWYSCHSCHTDGHTTGQRNDNLSDLSFGAPKRILPLGGARDTGPWAWNGQSKDLKKQIHSSIQNTMQGSQRTDEELAALATYVQSLKPAPSLDRMRGTLDEKAMARGQRIFHSQGCAGCHQPPTYTSSEAYNVGLADELGEQEFNPPSLLGVSQRDELFHDSRAKSLEEVLKTYRHGDAHKLTQDQRADLMAFLRSL